MFLIILINVCMCFKSLIFHFISHNLNVQNYRWIIINVKHGLWDNKIPAIIIHIFYFSNYFHQLLILFDRGENIIWT